MVSQTLGKNDGNGFPYRIYLFHCKKEVQSIHDFSHGDIVFSGSVARRHWMDYGKEWIGS